MKIRSVIYWAISLVVATYASGHAVASASETGTAVASTSLTYSSVAAIPEAARSILLFVGVLAVAFTYHRAWINFRSGSAS